MISAWISQGVIDLKSIFDLVIKFFSENTRYLFYLITAFLVFLLVKHVTKQLTFVVRMIINAIPSLHDIKLVPPGDKK